MPASTAAPTRLAARAWGLSAALAAAAVALFAALVGFERPPRAGALWLILPLLFAVAEVATVRVRVRGHGYTHSLSEAPLVLGLALADPLALVITRVAGTMIVLGGWLRQAPLKLAFNVAKLLLETTVAVIVYRALLGGAAVADAHGWLAAIVAVSVAAAVGFAALVAVLSVHEGRSRVHEFRWVPLGTAAVVAVNSSIGVVALLVALTEPVGLVFVVVLAGVTYGAYHAYGSWRQRHESLQWLHALTQDADTLPVRLAIRRILLQAADLMSADEAEVVVAEGEALVSGVRVALRPGGAITEERVPVGVLPTALDERRGRRRHARRPSWLRTPWGLPPWRRADVVRVPLRGRTGVIGYISVAGRDVPDGDDPVGDRRLLETFANHASVALENSRLVERLWDEVAERRHEASHDALTGLPNRTLFHHQVTDAIRQRRPGERLAVLLVDLDHFKSVNDTLGHHVGDRLLVELSEAMERALEPGELVARLGGDEFAVLVTQLPSGEEARDAAERLRRALARPVVIDGLRLELGGSIGIARCPDDGQDSSTLLKRADVAMYLAKAQRTGAEFYRPEEDPNTPRRLFLASGLREALDKGSLSVHYQPKAALGSGEVVGVEALARWRHPVHGEIPPDEFVPVAEQAGLIRPLSRFVIRTALQQWAAWAKRGLELEIAVNLSPWNLLDGLLAEDLGALLEEFGAPPQALRLEITETSMMTDPHRTAGVLKQAHALGVGLSIDDFGTGYSSLSWLSRLPVDELKIDRSFVQGVNADRSDAAIVRSTIELGRSLGLTVVAEGVEDRRTWVRLRDHGCHVAQGYLLSAPRTAEQLEIWLDDRRGQPAGSDVLRIP